MTIKEEAQAILKDRKVWGDVWDDYETGTLIDIVIGKIQRVYNLIEQLNNIYQRRDVAYFERMLPIQIPKIKDSLIDAYNYGQRLKKRILEKT